MCSACSGDYENPEPIRVRAGAETEAQRVEDEAARRWRGYDRRHQANCIGHGSGFARAIFASWKGIAARHPAVVKAGSRAGLAAPSGVRMKRVHLGDGVYASFDGYQICLTYRGRRRHRYEHNTLSRKLNALGELIKSLETTSWPGSGSDRLAGLCLALARWHRARGGQADAAYEDCVSAHFKEAPCRSIARRPVR